MAIIKEQETKLKSTIGAAMFLLLFQFHARHGAHLQIGPRTRALAYVIGEQVEFYRRIFRRLSECALVN